MGVASTRGRGRRRRAARRAARRSARRARCSCHGCHGGCRRLARWMGLGGGIAVGPAAGAGREPPGRVSEPPGCVNPQRARPRPTRSVRAATTFPSLRPATTPLADARLPARLPAGTERQWSRWRCTSLGSWTAWYAEIRVDIASRRG